MESIYHLGNGEVGEERKKRKTLVEKKGVGQNIWVEEN